ncbi:hypothetical protein ACQUWY_22955, partial [Ralstonia pseudosolanacearum]
MKPQKQTGPSRAHVSHDRSADADIGRAGRMPMQPGAERPMRRAASWIGMTSPLGACTVWATGASG